MILTPMVIAQSCSVPNHDVTVLQAVKPEYPDSARDLQLGPATVLVQVVVDTNGNVERAQITQSSHNMAIDRAALRAARASQYEPRVIDCNAVEGTYVFRADFAAPTPTP